MSERRGIIYGTHSILRRLWTHRNGRLAIIALTMIWVPFFSDRAIHRVVGTLPKPTRGQAYNWLWRNSDLYQVPILVMLACGGLLIGFVCLRIAVPWILKTDDRE